jgi:hypothetical protein
MTAATTTASKSEDTTRFAAIEAKWNKTTNKKLDIGRLGYPFRPMMF